MIRTLVVDDDYRVAELHREYVGRVPGFSVVGMARTGSEALAMVRSLRPDLVLLDVYLPDLSGLEVLRRMREADDGGPDVIAVTAARDVGSLRAAMRGGVLQYLVKPFRLATFEGKLTAYAQGRRRLVAMGEATQGDVDRVFATMRGPDAGEPLPKGLSESTLELVVGALDAAAHGLSAAEVAEAAGMSRVTARRYLDHLARLGTVTLSRRYGSPGRPEHRYRLGAGGRRRAPVSPPG